MRAVRVQELSTGPSTGVRGQGFEQQCCLGRGHAGRAGWLETRILSRGCSGTWPKSFGNITSRERRYWGGFSEKSPSNFPNCPTQRILFNQFLPGPLCCLWHRGISPHFLKPSVSLVPLTVISPPSLPTPLNFARLAPRPYPLYVPHQQNGRQMAGTTNIC